MLLLDILPPDYELVEANEVYGINTAAFFSEGGSTTEEDGSTSTDAGGTRSRPTSAPHALQLPELMMKVCKTLPSF